MNFYRRFIPNTVQAQRRLSHLIEGNRKNDRRTVNWTDDARLAFDECKQQLATATTLAYPGKNVELTLQTDASDTCVGAVLQQIINKNIQPLGFYSKALTETQQRYSTIDRELTAIYQAV